MAYKSQHYVPRSYLEGFADPDTPEDYEPYVWVCERDRRKPFKRAPKNIAEQSYYYSFRDEHGEHRHEIEEMLGQDIEGPAIPVLRAMVDGRDPENLSDDERTYLAQFLGFMKSRVPARRGHVEEQAGRLMKHVLRMYANHPAAFRRTFREAMEASRDKLEAEGIDPDEIDPEEQRQRFLNGEYGEIRATPVVSLTLMLELAPREAAYASRFHWRVLEAPDGEAFVTSDNPFVMVTTEELPPPYNWGVGWETPWMEATFPLAPSTCLLISQHHPPGRETLSSDRLHEVNVRTAAFSEAQVYSNRKIRCQQDLSPPAGWDGWTPVTDVTAAAGSDRK